MTIQEYIYSQSVAAGMTSEGACALLGNIQRESGFVTNNLENRANDALGLSDEQYTKLVDGGQWPDFSTDNGVRGGYGLIQVTLPRRKEMFLNYMKSRGKSISDLEGQVGFILWEMKNMYPKVWSTVTTNKDLYECTKVILYDYENPQEKVENLRVRYEYAQDWYKKLQGHKEVTNKMTQNESVAKVLNVARNELGYHEKASNSSLDDKTANSGSGNYTKYARDLDAVGNFYNGEKNGFSYCDVFVDWCFVKAFGADIGRRMIFQPMQSAGAGCLYSAQYYKQAGHWVSYPQPGDQIFFSYAAGEYSHTGIVESVANGMVNTIEGNTSDMVARRSYPLSSGSIVGYGRPNWDLAAEAKADDVAEDAVVETPAPAATGYNGEIYRKGASGETVREYQEKLMKLGYDLGNWGADGDFGNDTRRAVIKFQQDHNLEADGEIGPMTVAAIEDALKGQNEEASNAPVYTTAGVIKPDPVHVIVKPIEAEESPDDGFRFHEGDIVNFIGNGHYFSSVAKVGFACKPGRAMVRGMDKRPTAKHPYRVQALRNGGSTVNGWVDADAIEAI